MTGIQHIHIINGPNLNLLGRRELRAYNKLPFHHYYHYLTTVMQDVKLHYFQSNHEGALIDRLQEIGYRNAVGIVFNPAAYTHTSIALADTVAAIYAPVVEVHITDITTREEFRRRSYIRPYVVAHISGRGLLGYEEACRFLQNWGQ